MWPGEDWVLRAQFLVDDHSRSIYLLERSPYKEVFERWAGEMFYGEKFSEHPVTLTRHAASFKSTNKWQIKVAQKSSFLCVSIHKNTIQYILHYISLILFTRILRRNNIKVGNKNSNVLLKFLADLLVFWNATNCINGLVKSFEGCLWSAQSSG